MIDINRKPSENLPIETEIEESQTLIVPPPNLRERIQAAQRARILQIQPMIEEPESEGASDPHNPES